MQLLRDKKGNEFQAYSESKENNELNQELPPIRVEKIMKMKHYSSTEHIKNPKLSRLSSDSH